MSQKARIAGLNLRPSVQERAPFIGIVDLRHLFRSSSS
jgi:hypothetical protein